MRSLRLLAAFALALSTASVAVTEPASVHVRVHSAAQAGDAAADAGAAVPESHSHHQYRHHQRNEQASVREHEHARSLPYKKQQLAPCVAIANEPFKDEIVSACVVRRSGADFYYQTSTRLLRNCGCESYSSGVDGVDLGWSLPPIRADVLCFTKNATLSAADVLALFDKDPIRCDASAFSSGGNGGNSDGGSHSLSTGISASSNTVSSSSSNDTATLGTGGAP